jgi:hypothetical protein
MRSPASISNDTCLESCRRHAATTWSLAAALLLADGLGDGEIDLFRAFLSRRPAYAGVQTLAPVRPYHRRSFFAGSRS